MEEEPSDERERPGYPGDEPKFDPSLAPPQRASDPPDVRALADEADEIRRMVDEGAGSPEAIRDLAARLREHRAREEALWRSEVKPALVKENKGRLRGHARLVQPVDDKPKANLAVLAVVLLGVLLVLLVAANTSAWVLVLAVAALIGYAWYEGRKTLQ